MIKKLARWPLVFTIFTPGGDDDEETQPNFGGAKLLFFIHVETEKWVVPRRHGALLAAMREMTTELPFYTASSPPQKALRRPCVV